MSDSLPRLYQLNASYDPLQDRILLSASTTDAQEFRFWVTRRFLVLMWQAIRRILAAFAAPRAPDPLMRVVLSEFTQTRAVQNADFRTPYTGGTKFPLGDQPVLLSRVSVHPGSAGLQILRLVPGQGQGIDLALDEKLAHILSELLRQAAGAGQWALDLSPTGAMNSPLQPNIPSSRMH